MSAEMARFLIELRHGVEDTIHTIGAQAVNDPELTPKQCITLLELQGRYEEISDLLNNLIKQQDDPLCHDLRNH